MKISYCILAYNDPKLLSRTIKKLESPNVDFFIHVQKSVDIRPFKALIPEQYFINDDERIDTIWGDISCVEASVLLMKKSLERNFKFGGGYIILASGSDYPLKSNRYIQEYLYKKYPTIFFAFADFKQFASSKNKFSKVCFANRDNYWLSFPNTKFKLEIKPLCFIRPRCFKGQRIPIKEILGELPKALGFFFIPKKIGKLNLEWCVSETWMELAYPTVDKLIKYIEENPYIMEVGKYIHNPEECLLQTVINTIEKEIPRKNYLVNCEQRLRKNGSLEITDDDSEFVKEKLKAPDRLFMRKFSSDKSKALLDFIDKETKE